MGLAQSGLHYDNSITRLPDYPNTRFVRLIFACAIGMIAMPIAAQNSHPVGGGAALFARSCSRCHDGSDPRAPGAEALGRRSPQAIVEALTSGAMRYQGLSLTGAERRAIAEFLTGRAMRGTVAGATSNRCARPPPLRDPSAGPGWNGWSASLDNSHFQPAAQALLTSDRVPHLQLKWAFGFPDTASAWAQPTIAAGRLFVGSQNGTVYSLDAATGCTIWTFTAKAGVRASIVIGPRIRTGRTRAYPAYAADQQGFVYALNAADGALIWSRRVDGIAGALRRPRLRANLVVRGRRPAAGISMLHVSRRCGRSRFQHRRPRLEIAHHSQRTHADAQLCRRHWVVGACRRRHLVGADD
jgi:hypothetical protein